MADVRAQLTATVSDREFAGLILERDDDVSADGVSIRARLYPSVPAIVTANWGTARLTTEQRIVTVYGEAIDLNGSSRFRTDYPITNIRLIESRDNVIFLLDNEEGFVRTSIDPDDFVFDPINQEIVGPEDLKLYGVIFVTYDTTYRIINYTPLTTISLDGNQVTIIAGAIYAFYEGASAILDIDISVTAGGQRSLLFRALSDIVADSSLEPWEKPPNWPQSGEYPPGVSTNDFPSPNSSATRQRVHAAGYYDNFGIIYTDYEAVSNEKPYKFATQYNPQVYVEFANRAVPGLERGYDIAIRRRDEILNRLETFYPNFIGEQ